MLVVSLDQAVPTERDWFHLVALSGEPGQRWVEGYRTPEHLDLMAGCLRALWLLRQRRIDEGRDLLLDLFNRLPTGEPSSSYSRILDRHYFPVLAFYHYLVEEYEQAERLLNLAHEAVREAVAEQRFLLPFADSCLDFGFQQMRISRNRHRWHEMWDRTERMRAIMEGREPLCVLEDGTTINLSTLRLFYGSLTLGKTEQGWIIHLLDPALCISRFHQISREIFTANSPVIPYP